LKKVEKTRKMSIDIGMCDRQQSCGRGDRGEGRQKQNWLNKSQEKIAKPKGVILSVEYWGVERKN